MADGSSLILDGSTAAAAAAAAASMAAEGDPNVGGGGGGGGNEPSCIDRKYLVAACLSCSLSSAVWRLEHQLIAC